MQQEGLALFLRQSPDRCQDGSGVLLTLRPFVRLCLTVSRNVFDEPQAVRAICNRGQVPARLPRSPCVHETIVRQRQQPGGEPCRGSIVPRGSGHRKPHVLHEFVRECAIAEVALQVPPYPELMSSIQCIKSLYLTAGKAQHECFIGIAVISHERIVAAARNYKPADPERNAAAENPETG